MSFSNKNIALSERLKECADLDEMEGGNQDVIAMTREAAESILELQSLVAESQDALYDLSMRFTELVKQNSSMAAEYERTSEELIRACAELSGIKKQEPVAAYYTHKNSAYVPMYWNEKGIETAHKEAQKIGKKATVLYKYPVHQHSFTISGIGTFYADSELEITYLERLHGVGGKANLKAVDEEHF